MFDRHKLLEAWTLEIKIFFVVIILGIAVFIGQKNIDQIEKSQDASSLKENLVFRITWKSYSGRGEVVQKIVNLYNDMGQTDYKVIMLDGDEELSNVEELLQGNNTVDIYVLPYRFVQYFGHKNQLEDLTDSFSYSKSDFYENIWDLGVVGQKTFGIPWIGHSMGLIYNKSLLDKAGVDPKSIKSLDRLVAAFEKIEEKTDAKGIGLVGANHNDISWMLNQFIYGFGGSLVNQEGTEVTINSKASEEALKFYKNVLGKYAQDSWTQDTGLEVMRHFRNQKIAFQIQGLWGVTDVWKNGRPFETGVIPMKDIGLPSEVGLMMLTLRQGLNEQKRLAAIDFIEFLMAYQAQEMIMNGEYSPEHDMYYPFRLPIKKDIANDIVLERHPEFSAFLIGFESPSVDVPVPLWQFIKEDYYAPNLNLVMSNQLSIEDFLKKMQYEGDRILTQSK